jgi:tetratricopeptide (TPR) repeat protein
MPSVIILQCGGCGAALDPKCLQCDFCSSKNVFLQNRSINDLNSLTKKKYVDYFKNKLIQNSNDHEVLFNLGLFYLSMKLYDLSVDTFLKALEVSPNESENYFYLAISKIKGRRPFSIPNKEIKEIYKLCITSLELDTKPKYLILTSLLYYDHFIQNGLIAPKTEYDDLLCDAMSHIIDDEDKKLLNDHIIIRHQSFSSLIN